MSEEKRGFTMKEHLKSLKMTFILAAVLYIALGTVLLLWPYTTLTLMCYLFGGILLAYGVITIVGFFFNDSAMGAFRLELVLGILAAAVGVLFLLQPDFILALVPVVLGVYIAIDSLVNLKRTLELYRLEYDRWWVTLVLSLVGVALAVVILLKPIASETLFYRLVGIVFIYTGISDLWALLKVSRLSRELRKRSPIEIDPIDIE